MTGTLTHAELQAAGRRARSRRRRRRAARSRTRRPSGIIRDRRARGLFGRMRFTMAQPEVSCHPERLLPGARTVVSAALSYYVPGPEPGPGEGRLPRYTWTDRYAELREKLDALGRALGGAYRVARGREPARGPRGRRARRPRVLRQEHDADHPPPRFLGRPRHAPHRGGDRARAAARARLRLLPPLRGRVPDGRPHRPRRARRDALPLVLDAGGRPDPRARAARRSATGSTAATSARTSARGTAAPRSAARREPLPEGAEPVVSLVDWLTATDDELTERYERLFVPRNDPRFLRRNALVAAGNSGDTTLLPLVREARGVGRRAPARARGVGGVATRRGPAHDSRAPAHAGSLDRLGPPARGRAHRRRRPDRARTRRRTSTSCPPGS